MYLTGHISNFYVVQNTSLEMVVSEMYTLQIGNDGETTAQILFT